MKKYAWDNDCISQLLVAQKLISLLASILNIEKTHSGSFFWGQLSEDFWYAAYHMLHNKYVIYEDWKSFENPWPVRDWNPWLYHMLVTANRFMIDYFDSWYRFDYCSFQSQIFLPKINFLNYWKNLNCWLNRTSRSAKLTDL